MVSGLFGRKGKKGVYLGIEGGGTCVGLIEKLRGFLLSIGCLVYRGENG